MSYERLPEAFKYNIDLSPEDAEYAARCLVRATPDAPSGSSFAVTATAGRGRLRLWLSETSRQRWEAAGFPAVLNASKDADLNATGLTVSIGGEFEQATYFGQPGSMASIGILNPSSSDEVARAEMVHPRVKLDFDDKGNLLRVRVS